MIEYAANLLLNGLGWHSYAWAVLQAATGLFFFLSGFHKLFNGCVV